MLIYFTIQTAVSTLSTRGKKCQSEKERGDISDKLELLETLNCCVNDKMTHENSG